MCFGIEDVFNEKELHVNWGFFDKMILDQTN